MATTPAEPPQPDRLSVALAFAEQSEALAAFVHERQVAEFLASIPPPPPMQPERRQPEVLVIDQSPSTGACGGATNGADAYIARESGGSPSAENASGAWGCYQIMPGTWSSSCSDLGEEHAASAATQAACASRLPLSAWGG